MAKNKNVIKQGKGELISRVMVDVYNGVDRSTSRRRIAGIGEILYEAQNVFPYIQGRLMRRKNLVSTNRRSNGSSFPSFPAASLSGNPVIKKVIEFNDAICIIYEDSGDTGKLFMDSFDPGANTMTSRIAAADGYTFTANGLVDATVYNTTGASPNHHKLYISMAGSRTVKVASDWSDSQDGVGDNGFGVCAEFLQHFFRVILSGEKIGRTAVGAESVDAVTYQNPGGAGAVVRMLPFGYQTSSAGATSVMLIFKPDSVWVLTGVAATESMEQVVGNIGLIGKEAITYTPSGVCFVGRDSDGKINMYLLDRTFFTLHTIGHELYEELNSIPKTNYDDVVVSYDRNRGIRISFTRDADVVANLQEYWVDIYNGLKKRSVWGPFPSISSASLTHALGFSGGATQDNGGFFVMMRASDSTYKVYEETDLDNYDSTNTELSKQVFRSKLYDAGETNMIVQSLRLTARDNGAKFIAGYEVPKPAPVLELDFNEADAATSVSDTSPSNHTVTLAGNAQVDHANSFIGVGSLLLDGTGDWATIPDSSDWDDSGGKWTKEFRVDIDDLSSDRGLFAQATDTDNYMWIYIDTSGFVTLKIVEGGSEVVSLAMSDNALVVDTKYHIRVCELDGDYYIFVDGIQRATVKDTSRASNYTGQVYIGAVNDSSSTTKPFDGHIGNVRIYPECMSNMDFRPAISQKDLDNDTRIVKIGSYQMGVSGGYRSKIMEIHPSKVARNFGYCYRSNYDSSDNQPFEPSQMGFEFVTTGREIIS